MSCIQLVDLALWTALAVKHTWVKKKPHLQRRKVFETTYLLGVAFSEQVFIAMKITANMPNKVWVVYNYFLRHFKGLHSDPSWFLEEYRNMPIFCWLLEDWNGEVGGSYMILTQTPSVLHNGSLLLKHWKKPNVTVVWKNLSNSKKEFTWYK